MNEINYKQLAYMLMDHYSNQYGEVDLALMLLAYGYTKEDLKTLEFSESDIAEAIKNI